MEKHKIIQNIKNTLLNGDEFVLPQGTNIEFKPMISTLKLSVEYNNINKAYNSKKLTLLKSFKSIFEQIIDDNLTLEDNDLLSVDFTIDNKKDIVRYSFKNLYEVTLFQKRFFLYLDDDISNKSYDSFLEEVSELKTYNGGRKVLLVSKEDDYNQNKFEDLLNKSGIDFIFGIGKFDSFSEDKNKSYIWYKNKNSFDEIKHYLFEFVGSDDLVCIKTHKAYRAEKVLKFLKEFKHSKIEVYKKKDNDLAILGKPLDLSNLNSYKQHLKDSSIELWSSYFPFLFFFSKSTFRDIIIEEYKGSLLLYFIRENDFKTLELYFPPFPFSNESLLYVKNKIISLHPEKKLEILMIDDVNRKDLVGECRILFNAEEFSYNYDFLNENISKSKNLNNNIKRFKNKYNYEIRDYSIFDYFDCIKLLEQWNIKQDDKYETIFDYEYTKNCLRFSHRFDKKDIFGKVVLIDGEIKGFGFAGEMYENIANIFIVKSDLQIKGLSYFLKFELLKKLKEYDIVNDATDLGNEGLKKAKESFNPVKMIKVYSGKNRV